MYFKSCAPTTLNRKLRSEYCLYFNFGVQMCFSARIWPFIVTFSSVFWLAACGKPAHSPKQNSKTFVTIDKKYTPERTYVIDVDNTNLGAIRRPENLDLKISEKTELIETLKSLKINSLTERPGFIKVELRLMPKAAGNIVSYDFEFLADPAESKIIKVTDAAGLYELSIQCQSTQCGEAWMSFHKIGSDQVTEIRYRRTSQYLTQESGEHFKATDNDSQLIQEAIEYALPVERHQAEITHGKALDSLVVVKPEVDAVDETFAEGDNNTSETPAIDTTNEEPHQSDPHSRNGELENPEPENPEPESETVELIVDQRQIIAKDSEPEIVNQDNALETEPQPQNETPPILKNKNSETASDTQAIVSRLKLISNPLDAFKMTVPARLFTNNQLSIRDPIKLNTNFAIVSASQQTPEEPAFRMAVFAQALVDQKVKIYRNACNIFVRSVMTLAGYTIGRNYNANQFGLLFQEPKQGLNLWDKDGYKKLPNLQQAQQKLQMDLLNYSEDFGVVAQVDRTALRRHGHVGILVRIDGQIIIYDSSLDQRGPRKTIVTEKSLLNNSRPILNLYALPQLKKH